ncbi:hypothetical protein [uncultured Mediterranean phage]|nr:hypothetical protein [uncultured Mediterranean phage]
MSLEDLGTIRAANKVAESYQLAVAELTTHKYVRPRIPRDSAAAVNASEFVKLANKLTEPLHKLMKMAIERYSQPWCQEKFGKPYPPINVVIGPKNREHLEMQFREEHMTTPEQVKEHAKDIAESMLSTMKKDGALEILDGGWPADDALREEIRRIIE